MSKDRISEMLMAEGKDAITAIVKGLVDHPEEVQISAVAGSCVLFSISVNQSDLAKVIGKKGNKIISIRNIISGIGAKHRRRIVVEIIQDNWSRTDSADEV